MSSVPCVLPTALLYTLDPCTAGNIYFCPFKVLVIRVEGNINLMIINGLIGLILYELL